MFRIVIISFALFCSTLVITGCGPPRSERPKPKASLMDKWEEGQKFFNGEENYAVFGNLSAGEMKGAVQGLKDPAFKTRVDAFEALELPEGFEDKKDAKAEIIDAIRSMIKEANGSGDGPTLKTMYGQVERAKEKLMSAAD